MTTDTGTTLREHVARRLFDAHVSRYTWEESVAHGHTIIGECYEDAESSLTTIRDALVAAAERGRREPLYVGNVPWYAESYEIESMVDWLTATLTPDAPAPAPVAWWTRNMPEHGDFKVHRLPPQEKFRYAAAVRIDTQAFHAKADTRDAALDAAFKAALEGDSK